MRAERTSSPTEVCYERRVQVIGQSTPFAPAVVGAIALGGAIGATGRWGVAEIVETIGSPTATASWPWATLIVNVVGCAMIGLAARLLRRGSIAWDFAVTGVLGGFTTFSALAIELNDLADADRLPMAIAYGAVTLVAGVGATLIAHRPVEVGE